MKRLTGPFLATRNLVALCAILLWASAATAETLSIKAFYGTFKGTGIAENRDSVYFGVTVRDLDVTIQPAGQGFEISWTTVIRRGGDPNKPKVRTKSQKMTFLPTAKPGVYRGDNNGDPLSGALYAWARIKKNALITYVFSINQDGSYEVQSYTRRLVPSGMAFVFERIKDGEPVRIVKGNLVKHSR